MAEFCLYYYHTTVPLDLDNLHALNPFNLVTMSLLDDRQINMQKNEPS